MNHSMIENNRTSGLGNRMAMTAEKPYRRAQSFIDHEERNLEVCSVEDDDVQSCENINDLESSDRNKQGNVTNQGHKNNMVPSVLTRSSLYSNIQCPHCGRNFSKKAAERHIEICVHIQAKPKSLQQKMLETAYKNVNGVLSKPNPTTSSSAAKNQVQRKTSENSDSPFAVAQ